MAKRRKQRIGKKGPKAIGKPKEAKPLTAKGMASIAAKTSGSVNVSGNVSGKTSAAGIARKNVEASQPVFTAADKRYIQCFLAISIAITALYWYIGGRNLFVFPAIFLLSVGTTRFWRGPVRLFAEKKAVKKGKAQTS